MASLTDNLPLAAETFTNLFCHPNETNSVELDFVVKNASSSWEDLARELPDGRESSLGERFFKQEILDQIRENHRGEIECVQRCCRDAILIWRRSSRKHTVQEICNALKRLGRGLVAERLEDMLRLKKTKRAEKINASPPKQLYRHLVHVADDLRWVSLKSPVKPEDCREISSAVELDGYLYVSFNVRPKGMRVFRTADLVVWAQVPTPEQVDYCYGLVVTGRKIHCVFKPDSGSRCMIARLGQNREGLSAPVCPIIQYWPAMRGTADRIAFFGGYRRTRDLEVAGGPIATVTEFDTVSETWTIDGTSKDCAATIPNARAATVLATANDTSYLLGGITRNKPDHCLIHELKRSEAVRDQAYAWSTVRDGMTTSEVGATGFQDLLFIAGGWESRSCYALNPRNSDRVTLPPIPVARSFPAMAVFKGKLVIIGGQDHLPPGASHRYCDIHVLDLLLK